MAKFKLKPKVPMPAAPAGAPPPAVPAPPPPAAAAPTAPPPIPLPVPAGAPPPVMAGQAPKAPPPFPVVAASAPPPGAPPVAAAGAAPLPAAEPVAASARAPGGKKKIVLIGAGLAALLVLVGGGYFGYKTFLDQPPPPPPPPVVKKKAAPPPAATPAQPNAATASTGTPSETLNNLAHAPVNAINKAKGAVDARQASGQSDVDAALGGNAVANKAATAGTTKGAAPRTVTGAPTQIGPGLTASTPLDNAPDATPAFRSFVQTAKVVSVIGGSRPMATINGRVARPGETVDGPLGVVLLAIETDTRQLVFKDGSGALLTRRY